MNAGFGKTDQRNPNVDNNTFSYLYNSYNNPGFIPEQIGESAQACNATPAKCLGYSGIDGNGYDLHGYGLYSPGELFQRVVSQDIQRLISTAQANWRPFAWMQNDASIGMDLADRENLTLNRLNEGPASGTTRAGVVSDGHNNDRNFSAKVTSNSSWNYRPSLSFKTSLGADYVNLESDAAGGSGTGLPPGAQNVGQTAVKSGSNSLPTATKTLGLYIQELASVRDRLFITGAVRTDQNSAFGTNWRVYYAKASVSYIISDESYFPKISMLDQLRLRLCLRRVGRAAWCNHDLPYVPVGHVQHRCAGFWIRNRPVGPHRQRALGNPNLKPEKSTESEMGFESRLFNNKVNLDFTYYN